MAKLTGKLNQLNKLEDVNERIRNIIIKAAKDKQKNGKPGKVYPVILISQLLTFYRKDFLESDGSTNSYAVMNLLENEMKHFYDYVERRGGILICKSPKEITSKKRDILFIKAAAMPTSNQVDDFMRETKKLSNEYMDESLERDSENKPFHLRFGRILIVTKNMLNSVRLLMHGYKIEYLFYDFENGKWANYWEFKRKRERENKEKNIARELNYED